MFGLSFAAGASAGALERLQIEQRAERESVERRKFNQEALLRRLSGDAENTRRWEADHGLRVAGQKSLEDSRAAEAARDRAAAEKDANRRRGLDEIMSDPQRLAGLTPLQRLLTLQQYGVGNVGIHDVEDPEQHGAHTRVDADAKWSDRKRELDYAEQQRRSRPQVTGRFRLAPGADDPALPRGTQSYLASLRTKHRSFEAAAQEFTGALQDELSKHPGLQPVKAMNALRQMYTGSGGSSGSGNPAIDAVVNSAVAGSSFGGGRGSNSSQGAGGDPSQGGGGAPAPDAQLQSAARAALRQRLGREATEAEVQTVLSNPKNRQLLGGR